MQLSVCYRTHNHQTQQNSVEHNKASMRCTHSRVIIDLFISIFSRPTNTLALFLSLSLGLLHTHTATPFLSFTRTHTLFLFHPCSPILPPTLTLVLDSIHTHLLSGREGGGERSLLSLVCVSSGVCPSVPAYAMNIWPRNRCASSGTSDSLIKGGEP